MVFICSYSNCCVVTCRNHTDGGCQVTTARNKREKALSNSSSVVNWADVPWHIAEHHGMLGANSTNESHDLGMRQEISVKLRYQISSSRSEGILRFFCLFLHFTTSSFKIFFKRQVHGKAMKLLPKVQSFIFSGIVPKLKGRATEM